MNLLTIKKGRKKFDIAIGKHKFILGNSELKKIEFERFFVEFQANLALSEYQHENGSELKMYLDNKELNPKKTNIYFVSKSYDLFQELKMQTKSIVQKAIISDLSDASYEDTFLSIQSFIQMICATFNEENNIVKIRDIKLTPANFVKLIEPILIVDDIYVNEFDITLEELIILQLELVKKACLYSMNTNLIVVVYPIINKKIMDKINEINNGFVIILCKEIKCDFSIKDCFLLDSIEMDLSNEDEIYDFACNQKIYISDLKEGVIYMKNYVRIIIGLDDGINIS